MSTHLQSGLVRVGIQYVSLILACLFFQTVWSDTSLCHHAPNNCSCSLTEDELYNLSCAGLGFTEFPFISTTLQMKVSSLNLSNNYITNLPTDCLSNFTSLKSLTLSSNKWVCNADLIWLQDWLIDQKQNNNITIDYEGITCEKPEHLKNQLLIYVDFVKNLMSCVLLNDQSKTVLYNLWDNDNGYDTERCANFCHDESYVYAALYGTTTCICGSIDGTISDTDCTDACTNLDSTCKMTIWLM
ncbi:polycystin-1-like [Antedon mediterranea]|uniref:polycystin-1-like n=1 Tax=Antedon mediterranea TaxID=105859 RepID=UPI003AF88414